jgi:hypothetical protein
MAITTRRSGNDKITATTTTHREIEKETMECDERDDE